MFAVAGYDLVSCNATVLLDQEIIYYILSRVYLSVPHLPLAHSLSYSSRCVSDVSVCVCVSPGHVCKLNHEINEPNCGIARPLARVLIAYMNVNGTDKKREVNLISIECQYRRLSVWQPKELSCQGGHRQPGGFNTHIPYAEHRWQTLNKYYAINEKRKKQQPKSQLNSNRKPNNFWIMHDYFNIFRSQPTGYGRTSWNKMKNEKQKKQQQQEI